jgi:hypothetical protein
MNTRCDVTGSPHLAAVRGNFATDFLPGRGFRLHLEVSRWTAGYPLQLA